MSAPIVVTSLSDEPRNYSTTIRVIAVVVAIVTGGYLLPWTISIFRGLRNSTAIFWINLLLGWTLIFWIVALVKSCRRIQPEGIAIS
jgi:Superinfection immunity protein